MTPVKCSEHELRKGELGDSPRYRQALRDSPHCLRCNVLAVVASFVYWYRGIFNKSPLR